MCTGFDQFWAGKQNQSQTQAKNPKKVFWGGHTETLGHNNLPQQLGTNAPGPGRAGPCPPPAAFRPGAVRARRQRPELRGKSRAEPAAGPGSCQPPARARRMLLRENPAPVGATSECPSALLPLHTHPADFRQNFYFSRSAARECELPKSGESDPRWPSPPRRPNTKRWRTPHISSPELF